MNVNYNDAITHLRTSRMDVGSKSKRTRQRAMRDMLKSLDACSYGIRALGLSKFSCFEDAWAAMPLDRLEWFFGRMDYARREAGVILQEELRAREQRRTLVLTIVARTMKPRTAFPVLQQRQANVLRESYTYSGEPK